MTEINILFFYRLKRRGGDPEEGAVELENKAREERRISLGQGRGSLANSYTEVCKWVCITLPLGERSSLLNIYVISICYCVY